MKIQIEFEEVEAIRRRLEYVEGENNRLEKELAALDQRQLKENAIKLSNTLFNEYMSAVFKSLGFNAWIDRGVQFNIHHDMLGKPWQRRDDLEVTVHASVSKEFRSAFLNIGVVPQEVTELTK